MEKICRNCLFIFDGHKWLFDEAQHSKLAKKSTETLCPGCKRIEKRRIDGVVYLKGTFLGAHRKEVFNLIENVAEKAKERNVAARIFEIVPSEGGFMVETTEHALAERIGKELKKAFSGNLEIHWLKKEEFVRV
ncbi:MAG: BCAM0308 family protein, partial [Candidatus Subteraquimicrobiales bacterium]|nr:BCAM0308 family protein [Candidatus Subteraquimicrobiales bacterium]